MSSSPPSSLSKSLGRSDTLLNPDTPQCLSNKLFRFDSEHLIWPPIQVRQQEGRVHLNLGGHYHPKRQRQGGLFPGQLLSST